MTHDRFLPPAPVRALLVDDHPAVREGLALLLEAEGIEVSAAAGRRDEALSLVAHGPPDVAVVDLSLDGEDGTVLIADLVRMRVPALVYSMHVDARRVAGAFAAGALGYVTKREAHGVLVRGIEEVAAGRRFVSPVAAAALAESVAPLAADRGAAGTLSSREGDVYGLLGSGAGTAEIAAALRISSHTVESYYARILVKLGIAGMHELRRNAIEHFRDPRG